MTDNVVPLRAGISVPTPPREYLEDGSEAPSPVAEPGVSMEGVTPEVIAMLREEMRAAVADIEFRLAQQYEIARRTETGLMDKVYVEDIVDQRHRITGYTVTNNSPAAGSIAWASLHVVYMGVDYTIADGNTANKYVWFVKPGSGTTATLQSSNTQPSLGPNDALIFVNNGGVATSALETSVAAAVAPGSVTQSSLASDVSTILTNLQNNDVAQQAALDGAIVSYFQNDPPWPSGAPSPGGGNVNQGDIWYDANDGGAFRWSGTGGTPANTWVRIADTDTSSLAAKVNTKVTTYIAAAAPAAPAGGFTVGDLWMDTANGNLIKRWDGAAWISVQMGDAAISGVSGTKIGSGINGSNVTTGTVAAARVGAGVNGAVLGTATGTVGTSQIATGAVTPTRINAAFHLLY
jgi:hypothetical protein